MGMILHDRAGGAMDAAAYVDGLFGATRTAWSAVAGRMMRQAFQASGFQRITRQT